MRRTPSAVWGRKHFSPWRVRTPLAIIVKNSNILPLDVTTDEGEMLKKSFAMSLEEETGVRSAKRGKNAES